MYGRAVFPLPTSHKYTPHADHSLSRGATNFTESLITEKKPSPYTCIIMYDYYGCP